MNSIGDVRKVLMMDNPYAHGDADSRRLNGPTEAFPVDAEMRILQIIAGSLILGVVAFLVIVLITTGLQLDGPFGVLTALAAGFGVLMTTNHFVIPTLITGTQFRTAASNGLMPPDEAGRVKRCVAIYQSNMIIGLALLEGAAFFCLVALMTERHPVSLGMAVGLLSLMIIRFPVRERVEKWISEKLRTLRPASEDSPFSHFEERR